MKALTIFVLLLMLSSSVAAETFTRVDYKALSVLNILDPRTHHNEPLVDYSFEELSAVMQDARFRRWNDLPRVCESMYIMFHRVSPVCASVGSRPTYLSPVTARAYVSFEIVPPPRLYEPRPTVLVDPLYPPWAPTWQPYGAYW